MFSFAIHLPGAIFWTEGLPAKGKLIVSPLEKKKGGQAECAKRGTLGWFDGRPGPVAHRFFPTGAGGGGCRECESWAFLRNARSAVPCTPLPLPLCSDSKGPRSDPTQGREI